MKKLNFTLKPGFKNSMLFLGALCVIGSLIVILTGIGINYEKARKGIVEVTEFTGEIEGKHEAPLVDISYEEMRMYVFPNGSMAIFKFPQYLQYLNDGTHMIMAVVDGTLKVTVMSNNWDYYTIYCKEESLLFFNKDNTKEKSKKKRDF